MIARNYRRDPKMKSWRRLLSGATLLLGLIYVGVAYVALASDTPAIPRGSSNYEGSRVTGSTQAQRNTPDSQRPGQHQLAEPLAISQVATGADKPSMRHPDNPASVLYDQYDVPADYAESSQNFEPAL